MFGKEFSLHPEILLDSFKKMNETYEGKVSKKQTRFLKKLQQQYLKLFGVPEIGFQTRFLYAQKILGKLKRRRNVKSILDAGSGIGAYTFWLSEMFPKAKVVGWDTDKEKITFCNDMKKELKKTGINFSYKDLTKVNKGKNYSLIVNIDVLEHIRQYKKVLSNFYSLLEKGGYLYIHTPQPHQKRIFKQSEKWHHEDHVREGLTPQELIKALTDLGFKVVEAEETFGYFGKFAWEAHHILIAKSLGFAALSYPLFYQLAKLDSLFPHSGGWGIALLAKK